MPISEELSAKIDELKAQYEELEDSVAMTDVTEKLGSVATEIEGLPGVIEELRGRGYVYASFLEAKANTLGNQWDSIHEQIAAAIQEELANAQDEFDTLDALWEKLEDSLDDSEDEAVATAKKRSSSLALGVRAALAEADNKEAKSGKAGMLTSLGASVGAGKSGKGGLSAGLAGVSGGAEKKGGALSGAAAALDGMEKKSSAMGGMAAALGGAAKEDDKPKKSLTDLAGRIGNIKKVDVGDDPEEIVEKLEEAFEDVQGKLDNARERIEGLYGEVPSNVSQTSSQIREIKTYLDRADEASFDFLAGEDVFMVVEAQWQKTDKKKENPEGYFYITNQRLIMEQREKKGGFMGRGGDKIVDLAWESTIGAVEDVKSEKKGMLGGIDLVHIKFGSGAPFGDTTVEVKGGINAEWFAQKLERAAKGSIESERGVDHEPEVVEAIKNAPTMCTVCGASFTQRIVAGQTQLECEYCGAVVRLSL